uniref:YggT family protein n=1 Tax=Dictyopteris divaricata TaxID=156996 RepID=A0A2I4Q2N4_9PHAE|nr:hypothetical protein [Dictyopteris divaricata]YP_010205388.1 hypothetical protein LK366_pgp003 [Grateloupia livida]AQZ25099.1 hypothetical protein [Dictyopteris divaricata]UAV85957.1 hypothetical protein [Grateloupia livida]
MNETQMLIDQLNITDISELTRANELIDPTGIKSILNGMIELLRFGARLYYWILTIRVTLQWFPSINPYIFPLYMLIHATDFYLEQFTGLVPTILGIDMTTMCAFVCLEWIIRTLDAISFV